MPRISFVIAALLIGLSPALAQEAQPEAQPEVTIDPRASLDVVPKQAHLLTGLYATLATVEICAVTLDPAVAAAMEADRKSMELSLSMDEDAATKAYDQVKADVEKTQPDCAEASPDRIGVDAVVNVYAARVAAAPPATQ